MAPSPVPTTPSLWTWQVPQGQSGRADLLLLKALEGSFPVTRTQLKRLIEGGQVRVNGKWIKPSTTLSEGAQVEVEFPKPVPLELVPEDRPLEILFEDEHLLVINKPPGLTVHPSTTQKDSTLVHALLFHIKNLSGIGGVLRPGIVHRLDKNTSGALVISKSDAAHQGLVGIFSKHDVERRYWALCYDVPPFAYQKIESLIGRSETDRKKMSMKVRVGKKAVTEARVLETYSKGRVFASLIEAQLETGRTHQVRVHLTGIGHSVLGDPIYGKPSSNQPKWKALPQEIQTLVEQCPGRALRARVLGFTHPITGAKLRFEAEPPAHFQNLLNALRKF